MFISSGTALSDIKHTKLFFYGKAPLVKNSVVRYTDNVNGILLRVLKKTDSANKKVVLPVGTIIYHGNHQLTLVNPMSVIII